MDVPASASGAGALALAADNAAITAPDPNEAGSGATWLPMEKVQRRRSKQVGSLAIVDRAASKDQQVVFDNQKVPLVTLADRLRARASGGTGPQVFIRGDGGITLQDLIKVFDELKAANVQTAGIVTSEPKR